MKILITGMTQLHCVEDFYLRQQLKVVPSELALVRLLREAGHEVVQKPVRWGEDLDGYDKIITYICGADSFVTMFTDGALWTLKREDTLLAFDDWQTDRTLQDGTFRPHKKWEEPFSRQMNGLERSDEVDELHHDWCHNRRILIPCFSNGNMDLIFAKSKRMKRSKEWFPTQNLRLYGYDPNPFLPLRVPENPTSAVGRKHEWVVAGLSKENREYHKKWKPSLPVVELGGRGENGVRMTEPEAVAWFGERWLHAMPGYSHAGSGWWRSRPSQLAGGNLVTYCNPKEGSVYGPSWVIEDPLALEQMSARELADLAGLQRSEFFYRHPIDERGKEIAHVAVADFLD